eukprot:GHVP01069832.1.p1 GENE.GHVP01069832.1~~GHVP01069832.1.p1  ORF type:complete len:966 (+),score=167.00 GHVP01069832.1:2-2899(+)
MDSTSLINLFSQTYNPDATIRNNSEQKLEELISCEGFLPFLLESMSNKTVDLAVRVAMSIYFKNQITKHWSEKEYIKSHDKDSIKANLFQITCSVETNLRSNMYEAIREIITEEFPDKWSEILIQVKNTLLENDETKLHPSIVILRRLVKRKRNKSSVSNEISKEIDDLVLGPVLNIGRKLASMEHNESVCFLLKEVLETIHSSIKYNLPSSFQTQEAFSGWLTLVLDILSRPPSKDFDENDLPEVWEVQKIALQIFESLTKKYTFPDIKSYSGKKYNEFTNMFLTTFFPTTIEKTVGIVRQYASGSIKYPSEMYNVLCTLIVHHFKSNIAFPYFKDHISLILDNIIFPNMCFSDEGEELWESDPLEYVRVYFLDTISESYTTEEITSYFLERLLKARKGDMMSHIVQLIERVSTQAGEVTTKEQACKKDGCINIIGIISYLLVKEGYVDDLRNLITTMCVPELNSKFDFLKSRACWAIYKVSEEIEFQDDHAKTMLFHLLHNIDESNHLAVRVQSSNAIVCLAEYKCLRSTIAENLPIIIETLIKLMNTTVSEELPNNLDSIINTYKDEITPFIVQVAGYIGDGIKQAIDAYSIPLEGSDDGSQEISGYERYMAISAMFKSLLQIADIVKGSLEMTLCIENIFTQISGIVFSRKIEDLYICVADQLEELILNQKNVSESIWRFFPSIYEIFVKNPLEWGDQFGPLFDAYVVHGSSVVVSHQVLEWYIKIITLYVSYDENSYDEPIQGCILMESYMLHHRGLIDNYIPVFINIIAPLITSKDDDIETSAKVIYLEVFINAIVYNPTIALTAISEKNLLEAFLNSWNELRTYFTRVHDKRLSIIAICNILSTPGLGDNFISHMSYIGGILSSMILTIPSAIEKRKKAMEGIDDEGYLTDEEVEHASDYEDDDYYGCELEENECYTTPLDSVDSVLFAKESIKELQIKLPYIYDCLKPQLPENLFDI